MHFFYIACATIPSIVIGNPKAEKFQARFGNNLTRNIIGKD